MAALQEHSGTVMAIGEVLRFAREEKQNWYKRISEAMVQAVDQEERFKEAKAKAASEVGKPTSSSGPSQTSSH